MAETPAQFSKQLIELREELAKNAALSAALGTMSGSRLTTLGDSAAKLEERVSAMAKLVDEMLELLRGPKLGDMAGSILGNVGDLKRDVSSLQKELQDLVDSLATGRQLNSVNKAEKYKFLALIITTLITAIGGILLTALSLWMRQPVDYDAMRKILQEERDAPQATTTPPGG